MWIMAAVILTLFIALGVTLAFTKPTRGQRLRMEQEER